MRLSTKGRFAVTAMIDVALREQLGPVSLAAISVRHQISLSYLEQLFSKLRQERLVESTRGPGGGYRLGRTARGISVADIFAAVEGPAEPQQSVPGEADATSDWMSQALWTNVNAKMMAHMQAITLADLAEEQRARGVRIESPRPARRGVFAQPKPAPARVQAPNSVFALGAFAAERP